MSSVPAFVAGVVVSGFGYAYLSRKLVVPRNRLMLEHFPSEGLEPYRPERPQSSLRALWPGSASSSSERSTADLANIPASSSPPPEGLHPLVLEARNSWNASVHKGVDAVVRILYGPRGDKPERVEKDEGSRKSSASSE